MFYRGFIGDSPLPWLHCSWHVVSFFSFLVLFIFSGGLQKTKFFATIARVEMMEDSRFGVVVWIGVPGAAIRTKASNP